MEKQKIKYRSLWELKKLPNNPRKIDKEDFKKLVSSIKKFGVLDGRPFLLSNRTGELVIIGGNQRYEACKKLGIKEVPTFLFEKLSEEEEKEIIIRDNVSNWEWDYDILEDEWDSDDLMDWGLDVDFWEDFTDKNKEIDVDWFEDECILKLKYNFEEYNEILAILQNLKNKYWVETNEDLFFKLLKENV